MHRIALSLALAPAVIAAYAYLVYPVLLMLVGATRRRRAARVDVDGRWPMITVTVPVYNAVESIGATLERLLTLDYPRSRMQLLVISDASTDGTDELVRAFAPRGVELLRLPERRGKTAAENAAIAAARGHIIVNVDATVLVPVGSLKPLVSAFADPTVGLASGRDVSVGRESAAGTSTESAYVGYEMWIRDLETRVGCIVGASGCFYAFRRALHSTPLPPDLSWDFASALVARQHGLRAVSIPEAICLVPRTHELRTELRRKTRTMARGLRTLLHLRELMNPLRYGDFAWMLVSHKLMRWLPYLAAPVSLAALAWLSLHDVAARVALALIAAVAATGLLSIRSAVVRSLGRLVELSGFLVTTCVAGALAWRDAVRAASLATWDPTPRPEAQS